MVVNPFRSSQIANHWDLGMVLNLELFKTKTWASKHSSIRENHGNSVRACQVTSVVSDSATPWTVAHQAPLSMGFSRQDYLGWVAMPSSRGSSLLRDREQVSRFAGRFFTTWEAQ